MRVSRFFLLVAVVLACSVEFKPHHVGPVNGAFLHCQGDKCDVTTGTDLGATVNKLTFHRFSFTGPIASALAGDRLLGVLLVTDGGSVNNATTGYGAAGCANQDSPTGAGSCPQAFPIGSPVLLSVQCKDQGAMFAANVLATDAGEGIRLATDQFLMTSTGLTKVRVPRLLLSDGGPGTYGGMPDGGSYLGGVVAISPLGGAQRAECNIWQRTGNE